jgi:hypothetical protein
MPQLSGWPLVGWTALAVSALSVAIVAALGPSERAVHVGLRATADVALVFFTLAYAARPLHQLARSSVSRWLVRNRRYLGNAFAATLAIHGLFIAWMFLAYSAGYDADPVSMAVGGLAFVFVAAMSATSSDAAYAKLGARRWRLLHATGSHLVWFVFTFTLVVGAVAQGAPHRAVLAVLPLGALGLRIAAAIRTRRARFAPAAGAGS